MTTRIPTPTPVPDPLSADFGAKCYDFTVWQAEAAVAMDAVALEVNQALTLSLLGVTSDSTTSLPVTVTAKTLTVGTGLGYAEGMPLKLTSKANANNYIKGIVTAYNNITGQLDLLGKSIGGSGTFADWSVTFDVPDAVGAKISELVRTSDIALTQADSGSMILASGTWAQTFDTGNLTAGWYMYIKSSGEITIPASDGRTNWIMYPNELRLFRWNGTALTSEILHPFYATFTSSGNFIKPPNYSMFSGLLWGGGASGFAQRYNYPSNFIVRAGTGGACHPFTIQASLLANITSVVIGAGGTAATAPSNDLVAGVDGGNSTFSIFTAYGGYAYGSAGSGALSKSLGDGAAGGSPNAGANIANLSDANLRQCDSFMGGGYGGISNTNSGIIQQLTARAGHSYYGAAGMTGAYGDNSNYTASGAAGNSVYGGTAGEVIALGAPGNYFKLNKGTSIFGGTGGNADVGTGARVGTAGGVRGGGGGAAWSTNNTSAVSGAGGRGELQIWGIV